MHSGFESGFHPVDIVADVSMGNAGIAPQADPDAEDRNEDGHNRSEPE
jgi:hypothetical protein